MGVGAAFNNPLPIPAYVFVAVAFFGSYFMILGSLVGPVRCQYYLKEGNFKGLRDVRKKVIGLLSQHGVQLSF